MDSKEGSTLAHWAIRQAREYGARDAAVDVLDQREIEVEFRDRNVEKLQEANRHSLEIAIYLDNRYSSQTTNDLRRDSLERFIAEAVAITKYLDEDPHRQLPDPKYYAGQEEKDLQLRDPFHEEIRIDDRIAWARQAAAAALAESDRVVSATAGSADVLVRQIKVHSNGFEGEQEGTRFSSWTTSTVRDDQGRLVEDFSGASVRHRQDLPDTGHIGREATARAVRRLGQQKIQTEVMDLVVENRQVPRLLWALLGPMSGWALQQKDSFLEGRLGHPIASEKLTLIDDPLLVRGQASRLFDGEGMAARRRMMIDQGVLTQYYIDNYYGRKLGVEPTTGGSANLLFAYGTRSCEAIIRDLGRGVFVTGFIGGNSNNATGDFSFGITGHAIRNGALHQPVYEMNISGNMKELWNNLAEVGGDPYPYNGWRTPTLHFAGVQFSGV